MPFVNDIGEEPKHAVVREDICDGCAFCVDVCPRHCIKLESNPDRPSKRHVRVLANACSGCGACQGTCPKEAIYIPGLSSQDLRNFVTQAIKDAFQERELSP